MTVILIGAIITIIGALITAVGTFRQNKSSSLKSDSILANTGLTVEGVRLLQSENSGLKLQVKSLSIKQDELLLNQDTLRGELEPFIKYANTLYPTLNENEALEKLSTRLNSLSTELATVKNTIKSFDATVYIKFSGKWKDIPYPLWSQPAAPTTFLKWTDKTGKLPDIEFKSQKINFVTVNKNTGAFDNILGVQPGSNPLGELIDYLSNYNQMSFWFTLSSAKNLVDYTIEINEIRIVFSINGSKRYQLISNEIQRIDLKNSLSSDGNYVSPTLTLDGKIVDITKITP